MSGNNSKYEKLSFWKLLENVSIVIPIIQRSYAQGRGSQRKVRDNFLDALYGALAKEPEEPVELDFVYGSKIEDAYQPLDGQQRLTTLFLLHWYIAAKEKKADVFKERLEKKFRYETRVSSGEFCDELTTKGVNFDKLLLPDTDKGQSKNNELSEIIKDSYWFVSSWEEDPTISAMLVMLDAIHLKFKNNTGKLWEKLIDEEEPRITFFNIILEKFGLSDDLYIKMNARGKPLTTFENFKSQFEKFIEENEFDTNIKTDESFAHKIDTVWTDLFWQYREKQKDGSCNIDNKFINFIAGAAINYYAEKKEITENKEDMENVKKELYDKRKSNTDDAVKTERIEKRIQQLANKPAEIIPEDFPTKNAFQYLIKYFNIYSVKQGDKYKFTDLNYPGLKLWDYFKNSLFKDLIQYPEGLPQYKPRVLFYAQTVYLLEGGNIDETAFSDWLRVVRNIVENTDIDHPNSFISAVDLVKELSKGCRDIYTHLAKNEISSGYAKDQVKEEIEKAKIITANKKDKEIIHKTEDTNICKGKIDLALYCIDYDINKDPDVSNFDPEKFEKIFNVLKKYSSEENLDNNFRRAFFTIGKNDFYTYWYSTLWAIPAPKRKIIISVKDLNEFFIHRKKLLYFNYFKELIVQLSENDINTIINKYKSTPDFTGLPDWKKRIIEDEKLLDLCKGHYIAVKEEIKCCWLIKKGSSVANNDKGRGDLIPVHDPNKIT